MGRLLQTTVLLGLLPSVVLGCARDEELLLGDGEFAWSKLAVSILPPFDLPATAPTSPVSEWQWTATVEQCEVLPSVYGVAWSFPCEGEILVRVDGCRPDEEVTYAERCEVTLERFELTLHASDDEIVADGATLDIVEPVEVQEYLMGGDLGGSDVAATGTLSLTGRAGNAVTAYSLQSLEFSVDYTWNFSSLRLAAEKPGG